MTRKVLGSDGKLLKEDSFPSRYIAEDAIYLIGKGGKLPAGQTLSGLYPGYTGPTTGLDLAHWVGAAKPPKKKLPAEGTVPTVVVPGADGTATTTGDETTTTGTTGTEIPTGTTEIPAG